MRILITVDPEIPVPPNGYGGIERIVSSLSKEFAKRGHEVFLLANPKSTEESATKIFGWKGLSSVKNKDIRTNAFQLKTVVKEIKPDVIHSFSRLLYLYPTLLTTKVPIVQSYQREISKHSTRMASFVGRKRLVFTACGEHMFQKLKNRKKWHAIHNFTDTNFFTDDATISKEYLFWLGRIENIKGTKEAIHVALETNQKLIIAGNIEKRHQPYFLNAVKPHLSNPLIKYVGLVDDEQKRKWFRGAKAFLFPIKWEEPFGIVMAESMACGTPVIAFNRGSVNEVIENDVNGYKVETISEMIDSISKVNEIDREKVRKDAENRFSIEVIAAKYLGLFGKIVG